MAVSRSTRRPRLDTRDDSGQVATGLIICAVLALIAIGFGVMLPIGSAVNQKSGAQNAADAAALAGADNVIQHVIEDIATLPDGPFQPSAFFCGLGAADAGRLAQSNGAHVTSYCYDWRSDQATVEVEANKALSGGQHSKARAVAETGVPWDACHFTGVPTSTPTPTPTTKPTPTPTSTEPPEPVALVCGGTTIAYDRKDGHLVVHDLAALRNVLKARLVD
jgi:hypothetical protein